jgi:FtsZ-interacting cell division protein ZipA
MKVFCILAAIAIVALLVNIWDNGRQTSSADGEENAE